LTERPLRLVLICPTFFGYDRVIADAAAAQGYCVTVLDARAGTGTVYKSALKVFPTLTRGLTQARFRDRFAAIRDPAEIDHILLIKGDGMTAETVCSLRALMPNARLTVYLWDALRNMPGMRSSFKIADRVFSFDQQDCDAFGWSYLPLFSRTAATDPSSAVETPAMWDWSFIGSLHSDRHRVLRAMVAAHPQHRYLVHCYVQNGMVKLVRSLSDPGILSRHPPLLSSQVMGYSRYQEVVRHSRAVVDVEHPLQIGMTMRTIETLLSGKKLITTNAAVMKSNLYHVSRVAVIDRAMPRICDEFLATPFLSIPKDVQQSYELHGWLKRLLS
jgi:hypothetical protein